ncbi:response regulator [Urechidicola sp. KH5]
MKTLKILFIDDDEIERLKFERIIKQINISSHVTSAYDGEDALNKLNHSTIDLIILDLNMPKMNGTELLHSLKMNESLKYIPIVILTSSTFHVEIKYCFEIGIAGYFIKPLRYENYKKLIEKIISYWGQNKFIE